MVAVGDLCRGLKLVDKAMQIWQKVSRRYALAAAHGFYGQLYLRIIEGSGPKSFSFLFKNIWSLIKLVPCAARKAEEHFNNEIRIADEIGAKGLIAQAYFGLGLVHKAKKRMEMARENIIKAVDIFEEIEADGFLMQSKKVLSSIG
ncbi:MAG: hypothetical protein MUC57_05295 [Desulfobacterales bacterium]|nr:hypothetical protein [Desulfobacterales bacterium]